LDTPIFIPTLSEQEQITNFLDKKIPTINHTIEQLENTLSIIEEKRSSLITQVVTKGLNPDVKMMDSEIEWIEQYPTHWMRSRIRKASSRVTDGAHVSPDESSRDIPFVSIIDITNGIIDFENSLRTSAESFVQHKKHNSCPKPCDVLFSKDGTIGVTAVISEKIDFVVSSSLVIISPITDLVDSKYLDYWLRSNPIMEMVERVMSGSALRRISVRKVGDLPILLPPVQEQLEIVEYLDTNVSNIENAIKFIVQKIYTLNEYRSALISAAVTGKIDVREL
jgi:type I restriction enzyme S subunit